MGIEGLNPHPQPRIFVSYRSDDTGQAASRLFGDLAEMYGRERVFIDHEQIKAGQAWAARLARETSQAAVMLVLVGERWLKAQNPTTGDRRLNEPDDWVRREIQMALEAGATVVPILVDGARQLTERDLLTVPQIANLAAKQSMPLRRKDWDADLENLQRLLLEHGIKPSSGTGDDGEDVSGGGAETREIRVRTQLAPPNVPWHFRGRGEEIRRVLERFREGRWCALVAIGGSGKTAIAAQIATNRRKSGNGRVVWLGLAGSSDAGVPQEWLANAFGHTVRSELSLQQRGARLRAVTAHSSTLIVFDDPTSDAQLSQLLSCVGAGNDVLITARERLGSMMQYGVEVIDVPPLPVQDATGVLLEIIGASANQPEKRREWEALAQAVGNHPLSLEVLAGDLLLHDDISPALYLRDRVSNGRWSEGEDTLVRLRKSLVDSVAHSRPAYDVAFAALGAFEGSAFSAAAVAEVCALNSVDEARAFLLELRRRLCVRRNASGLYSLHPFVAETARQVQPAEADGSARITSIRRHIAYYHELLRKHGGYEWNMSNYPALIPEERELVRAIDCAATLADNAPPTEAHALLHRCADMTSRISWYLHWRGHWDLRARLSERITTWAEQGRLEGIQQVIKGIVGNLYVDTGWRHLDRGDLELAGSCADRGQQWLANKRDAMFAKELAGQVALRSGREAEALHIFDQLRASCREGARYWLVFSYRLVDALQQTGDGEKSSKLLDELLLYVNDPAIVAQQIDDVRGRILYRVAVRRLEAGLSGAALKLAREAVAAFALSGIVAPERRAALILAADLLRQSGAADEYGQLLTKAREQAQRDGDFETLMATDQLTIQNSGNALVVEHLTGLADL